MELNMKIEDLVKLFPNSQDNMVIICNIKDADVLIENTIAEMNFGGSAVHKNSKVIDSRSITYQGKNIHFIDQKDADKFYGLASKIKR